MQAIVNIGILAHVDAGKTTLTEQFLFHSGAIARPGSVDAGDTVTDSMALERQRGITIRARTTSFTWAGVKINLIDTPGHMDFIAEVERSFGVLDGAVLVLSAREGVQSQTRAIFRVLKRMNIPTVLCINKIDRMGVNLPEVYRQIARRLTPDAAVLQTVEGAGENAPRVIALPALAEEVCRRLLDIDEPLSERYLRDEALRMDDYRAALIRAARQGRMYPVVHTAAARGIGIEEALEAVVRCLPAAPCVPGEPSGVVYKVEREEKLGRCAYVKVTAGSICLRRQVRVAGEEETLKIRQLYRLENAAAVPVDEVSCGDIAVLPGIENLHVGSALGQAAPPADFSLGKAPLMTVVTPAQPERRKELLDALTQLSDEDPLLDLHMDGGTREIALRIFGRVQVEVLQALLAERFGLDVAFGPLTTIYREQPCAAARAVFEMGHFPNPYWATIGLRVEPAAAGAGVVYESKVSPGYLNPSFQAAVRDGVTKGCEQGNYGWEVTDIRVVLEYAVYSSVMSTPADFRRLAPYVLGVALHRAGTQLLEPFCAFELEVPDTCAGRALFDLEQMRAQVDDIRTQGESALITGTAPEQTARDYPMQVTAYTRGRGAFSTRPLGYEPYRGQPVCSPMLPEMPDKLAYLFLREEKSGTPG